CENEAEDACEEKPCECVCEDMPEETPAVCECEAGPEETCEEKPCECICEDKPEDVPAECPCDTAAEETNEEKPCECVCEEKPEEAPEECACETETEETCKCQPEECTCEAEPEETCEVPAEEVCENEQPCECQPEECVCECETEECACEPEAEPADDPEEEEADSLPTIEWLLADKAAEKTSTGLSIDLSLREENAKFENALTREVPPAETSDEETPAAEGPAETHVEEVQAPDTAVEETVSAEVPAEEPDPLSYEAYYEDTTPEQFLRKLEGMLGPSAYERTEAPAPAPAVRDDIFEPDVLKAVTGDDLSSIDLDAANAVAQAFGAEIAKPAEALAKAEEPVIVSLAAGAEELARIYEEAEARARQAEEAASEAPAGETSEAPAEGPAPEEDVMLEDLLAGVPNIDVAEALSEVAIPEMFEETTEEAAEEPAETAPAGETDVEKAAPEAAAEAPAEEAAPVEETKAEAAAPAEVPAEEPKPQSKEPSFRNTSAGDTENFNLNAPEDYYRPNINYSKQLQKRTGSQILGMVIFGGLCLLASLL
ncbi:MAG: hypothetical protein IJM17_02250, partial [Firmicutes bacterium]|nr:hypothetical protein [Bacillota bacterium]